MSAGARAETGKKLFRSSLTVGAMTMISRVLGLFRDIALAVLLGATAHADAFYVAFKIPNFLRRLFGEGAFSQAFVPVLSEYRTRRSVEEVRALVAAVSGVLGGVLAAFTALAVVAAPVITMVFAPGFMRLPAKMALTTELIRITFPYLFLISMAGLVGAVLNSYSRFAVPAFTPVFLNLTMIAAALYGVHLFDEPVYALAWAVLLAGVVQYLFQLPFVARIGMLPRPRFDPRHEGVRRIMKLMLPALFGVSVSQINLMLDTILASFLPTGSVTWLVYSDRLTELPLGVFGIAIATVILPALSRDYSAASREEFEHTMDWAIKMILMIAVPATCALVLLGEPILTTLFQYGAMTPRDMRMASYSLAAMSLGLPAFMLIKVLASAFYSRQDLRTPVRIGIMAMVFNMVLNLLLVIPLHHFWKVGHAGLALATAGAACLNAGLLLRGLMQKDIYHPHRGFGSDLARIVAAAALMVVALAFGRQWLHQLDAFSWMMRVLRLGVVCLAGLAIYFGVLFVSPPQFLRERPPKNP
jgi:putative peptidoglycan lipid II flippase